MIVNLPNGTSGLTNVDLLQYSAHLEHNNLLRPHDLAEVAQARLGPLKELRGLEGEMKVLNVVLGALRRRKESLEALLWAYDTILAPIRRLPDDTLMEIFCHCLPTARNARPFVSEAPLLLTLVCKKWRTLALTTPHLWSTLHVPILFNYHPAYAHAYDPGVISTGSNHRYNYRPALTWPPDAPLLGFQMARQDGLDQWLRRSGTHPLSISLHDTHFKRPNIHFHTSSGRRDITALLDLIARHADRLSTLELVMAPLNLLEELGSAIMRHFDFTTLPHLRQLRVSTNRNQLDVMSQTSNPLSMFFSAKLQQLAVRGFLVDFHGGNILCPSSSTITILSMHAFSDTSCAHYVLSKLHKLEQCHVSIAYPSNRHVPHIPGGQAGSNSNTGTIQSKDESVHSTIYLSALHTLSICGPLKAIQDLCEPLEIQSLLTLHLRISPAVASRPRAVAPGPVIGCRILSWGSRSGSYTMDSDQVVLPDTPPVKTLSAFLARCTSLRALKINPCSSGITLGELHSIFSSLPHITSLVMTNDATDVSAQTISDPASEHAASVEVSMRHTLQLLLRRKNEWSKNLPNLTSFTWIQSPSLQMQIPNDLLVEVIKDRLYSSHDAGTTSGMEFQHPSGALVASLKDIKIQLFANTDAIYIERQLLRHAQSTGLQRGVHFNLDISVHPPPKLGVAQVPRYVIPMGYTYKTPVFATEDNLDVEYDVTWPLEEL